MARQLTPFKELPPGPDFSGKDWTQSVPGDDYRPFKMPEHFYVKGFGLTGKALQAFVNAFNKHPETKFMMEHAILHKVAHQPKSFDVRKQDGAKTMHLCNHVDTTHMDYHQKTVASKQLAARTGKIVIY